LATGVTEIKLNPQVTVEFTGAIAQVNATAELKLLSEVTVIVEAFEFPATVVADTGDAVTLKLFTTNVYAAVRLWPLAAPVTVTV
jgi:hypothetical protein